MSVTGIALILFLTFHGCMNIVALFSGEAYNMICELLGANWYAVVATLGLAALAVIHIVYAFILTAQNRTARGSNRYDVATTVNAGKVEWASKNMLVLGIIVCLGLLLHLFNFWYNMMFAELVGVEKAIGAADGFGWIVETFSCPVYVVLYIIWLVALWFHLTHGFWSAMQTLGWNGKTWFCRWKVIGNIYATLLMLAFLVVVLAFFFKCAPSLCKDNCCKAKTECVMQAPCDKAQADCCKAKADCCEEKAECCDAEKACKCEDCKCEPCECAEKAGCKCEDCKCEDCKC
jgi:succinate dehydrogenase / fumarate reductase cytochrome b subunit